MDDKDLPRRLIYSTDGKNTSAHVLNWVVEGFSQGQVAATPTIDGDEANFHIGDAKSHVEALASDGFFLCPNACMDAFAARLILKKAIADSVSKVA